MWSGQPQKGADLCRSWSRADGEYLTWAPSQRQESRCRDSDPIGPIWPLHVANRTGVVEEWLTFAISEIKARTLTFLANIGRGHPGRLRPRRGYLNYFALKKSL